ncbi:glutathione S-transferase N-terminal domain-containing protein [uncultured Brevundimonas sp.]|uniref:glutathione S-transferase family protein n=1 Tax=uncultured Brevundimonas sp. TaxID=213418 RepID=UPI0030ED338C|tara:strand:- start:75846 stop:76463 length:618 start_codon:yes stop_codon:yes gene_type:complete
MLKLYYSPGACALASHVALEESGATYEVVRIDLSKGEQKTPEYLAINPAGVTPALETERGVITQNAAILAFIAQTRPQQNLAPVGDPYRMARFNAFNGWLGSSLHPALGRLLFSRPALEGDARAEAVKVVLTRLQLVEDGLLEGTWVMGDAYTLSDGYLMVFERWARLNDLLDPTRFPRLNSHLDRTQERAAVQRVLAAEGLEAV